MKTEKFADIDAEATGAPTTDNTMAAFEMIKAGNANSPSTNEKSVQGVHLKENDILAMTQETPFGISRWALLGIYVIYTALTGCVYVGWPALSHLLFSNNAFLWICEKNPDGTYVGDRRNINEIYTCTEQDVSVQRLFSIALTVHMCCSSVAGILLDNLGPKYTAMLGQLINASAWFILAANFKSSFAYYVSFILIGTGSDIAFLPTLPITALFPGLSGLIIAIIGSAASISFAVPILLDQLVTNTSMSPSLVALLYAIFGPLLGLITAFILFPMNKYKRSEEFRTTTDEASFEPTAEIQNETAANSPTSSKKDNINSNNDSIVEAPYYGFREQAYSEYYIWIIVYFSFYCILMAYYQISAHRMLSDSVINVLEILIPLSFIPCIFWGLANDRYGTITVLFMTHTSGTLAYFFTLFGESKWTAYISVIFYAVYLCFFTSQVFCYIENTFGNKYFGTLIGFCCTFGGVVALANNIVYQYATVKSDKSAYTVQVVYFAIALLVYGVLGRLYYIKKRNCHPFQYKGVSAIALSQSV